MKTKEILLRLRNELRIVHDNLEAEYDNSGEVALLHAMKEREGELAELDDFIADLDERKTPE
jgi:hypothetical protein